MIKSCLITGVIFLLSKSVLSQTVAFNPVADNTIYQENASLSNGAGGLFYVGRTGGTDATQSRRALIKFDLGSIPAGSTINSVSLKVVCAQQSSGAANNTVELHRCLEDWGEGASVGTGQGALATVQDATWTCSFSNGGDNCSVSWSTEGGVFTTQASASVTVTGTGDYTFQQTQALINDVKNWVDDPASNFGWLLKGSDVLKSTRGFLSKEGDAAATVLLVNYTAPANCTGPNTWTGKISNEWEVAGNWSCDKIPDQGSDVEINEGNVVVNSNAVCRSIIIKQGVNFTVNNGFSVTITP